MTIRQKILLAAIVFVPGAIPLTALFLGIKYIKNKIRIEKSKNP